MAGRECYHCRQWVAEGEPHDCWTTTEAALTRDLSLDLREAWERLRETAAEYGEQRIYASHNSIMFSRKSCYFFVRPKRSFLELCIFLGRPLKAPVVHRAAPASKSKFWHLIRVTHRDQVEAPITDWLREAYDFAGMPGKRVAPAASTPKRRADATRAKSAKGTKKKTAARKPRTTSKTKATKGTKKTKKARR